MTLPGREQPLPLNLVASKDLVSELQSRFDIFVAAGIKVRSADDLAFQFGIKGDSLFDIISMLEFLKIELIMKRVEKNNGNGNYTTTFD